MLEKQKRKTGAKLSNVAEAVFTWYKQQRSVGVPVRGMEIQLAAEKFVTKFGVTNFEAGTGSLYRFRNRHSIVNRNICGEILSADVESVDPFKHKLNTIIAENHFSLSQVYNADEMGLNWKAIPKDTSQMGQVCFRP